MDADEIKRREFAKKRKEELEKFEKSLKQTKAVIKLGDFRDLIKKLNLILSI